MREMPKAATARRDVRHRQATVASASTRCGSVRRWNDARSSTDIARSWSASIHLGANLEGRRHKQRTASGRRNRSPRYAAKHRRNDSRTPPSRYRTSNVARRRRGLSASETMRGTAVNAAPRVSVAGCGSRRRARGGCPRLWGAMVDPGRRILTPHAGDRLGVASLLPRSLLGRGDQGDAGVRHRPHHLLLQPEHPR
jgi:hypothetical protein